MVILVLLIHHFLGILLVTEFQATQFHEKYISWVHRHPNTGTNKCTGNFLVNSSETKIHGVFHSHIYHHTYHYCHQQLSILLGIFLSNHIAGETT